MTFESNQDYRQSSNKAALGKVSDVHMLQMSHRRVPQSQMNLEHVDIPEHQAMQVSNQNCQVAVHKFVMSCWGLFFFHRLRQWKISLLYVLKRVWVKCFFLGVSGMARVTFFPLLKFTGFTGLSLQMQDSFLLLCSLQLTYLNEIFTSSMSKKTELKFSSKSWRGWCSLF